jgi:hypothetical protein
MRPETVPLNVRLGVPGVAWIDQMALDESGIHPERRFNRTDIVRAALAVARKHEKEVRDVLRSQV